MAKINTILQCFVDLNLELDENATFSLNLPNVSFANPQYNTTEGQEIEIEVTLSEPSPFGFEEVEVGVVVNNTDITDFSSLGETYPRVLTFSAGQQTQIIKFSANEDLIEEGIESFNVILGYFTNCNPGPIITTTVNIIDQTNLKEVFINEQGGVLIPENGEDPARIDFTVFEGNSRDIKVSLDSPSVLGVESVGIQITNITTSSGDYGAAIFSTNISWAPGEQDKVVTIQTNSDDEIESDEILQIELINPINANMSSPSIARVTIVDSSPERFYAQINLQDSYIQLGGITAPTVEARWVDVNVSEGQAEPTQNQRRFLKFGAPIQQSYTKFNQPNGQAQGSGYDAGSNVIVGYQQNLFGNLQHTNVIFFGEKPGIDFGPGQNWQINNNQKEYGDLRLRIQNISGNQSIINGQNISPGDSVTLIVNRPDFKVLLSANEGLVTAGSLFNGENLAQDTLTQCLYNFTFEVDFEELGFKLRKANNSISSNKEINIGTFLFTDVYSLNNAVLPQNEHNLVTRVLNVWPYWESQISFPANVPYCLASSTLANQVVNYPTDISDLQDCILDGAVFLHQDLETLNSTSPYKTSYVGFSFLPSGQTAALSGCTGREIEYRSPLSNNKPYTNSIPFFVVG